MPAYDRAIGDTLQVRMPFGGGLPSRPGPLPGEHTDAAL
jgi:hypothetical protein